MNWKLTKLDPCLEEGYTGEASIRTGLVMVACGGGSRRLREASLDLMNKRIKKPEGDKPLAEIGVGKESGNGLTASLPGSSQLERRT